MTRLLWLGFFALTAMAALPRVASADIPGPWPSPSVNRRPPPPAPDVLPSPLPDPAPNPDPAPKEMWPDDPIPRPKPRRTGVFRSCGTGTPAALAAIGVTWGMLWLGNRFARSQRSPSARA